MKTALRTMSVVVGTACAAAGTNADVLWHQPYDTGGNAWVVQEFTDFTSFSTYAVNDVRFDQPVVIDRVTVYVTDESSGLWVNLTEARLHIYRKGSDLPPSQLDPRNDSVVNITGVDLGDTIALTLEDMNLRLDAGDWWIGLTPIASLVTWGLEKMRTTNGPAGGPSAVRNPGRGYVLGFNWGTIESLYGGPPADFAMTIEGRFVTASASMTDVTRTLGLYISGGVPELLDSDDTYYVLQSGPGFDPSEPHPARADFTFDSAGFPASTLDITLEEKANIGGPTAVVLLRNRVNSAWDEIARHSLSPTDQTFDMTGIPAAEYIDATNGRITVRVRTFAILVLDPTIRGIFSHDFVGVRMHE